MNLSDILSLIYAPTVILPVGLFIGAVLPPLFYPRRKALALCLNLAGLLFYLSWAPMFFWSVLLHCLTFAAVEGVLLLLCHLWRRRAGRKTTP